MLKGGLIPAYSKPAIEQELSEQSQYVAGCWRAAQQGKPWRQADCTGFLRAVTLKWLLSSLHSRVSMALVQCKRSPGSGARRGVRHSLEDECPAANWSDWTRDNASSSTGASLVRKLWAQGIHQSWSLLMIKARLPSPPAASCFEGSGQKALRNNVWFPKTRRFCRRTENGNLICMNYTQQHSRR